MIAPHDTKPTVPCPRCGGTSSVPASELTKEERRRCRVVAGEGPPWKEQQHECPACTPYGFLGLVPQNVAIVMAFSADPGLKARALRNAAARRHDYSQWLLS